MTLTVPTLETINGFVVVAERPSTVPDERIILAVRPDKYLRSGFEYVTARARLRSTAPNHWQWGHYLDDLAEATEDYLQR